MKSGFSLKKKFVPVWKGNDKLNAADQFVAELSMPTVQDVFSILERLQANGVTGKTDSATVGFERATAIAAEAGSYLPKYVALTNAEDFSIADVIQYPPYFDLAIELLFALIAFSQPNEADENSK
jgi:hypothetical protein